VGYFVALKAGATLQFGSIGGPLGFHRSGIVFKNRMEFFGGVRTEGAEEAACVLFFLLFCLFASVAIQAEVNPCDPSLKLPSENSPNSYIQRGDRCEGIYAREVAGDILMVGSVTEMFDDFTPTSGGQLYLSWTAPGNEAVHLRVYSLKPHFYYRMDSSPPAGSRGYVWPTNILTALKIRRDDLGVVASAETSLSACGPKHEIYLPLRIGASAAGGSKQNLQVALLSDVELSEVYVTVSMLGPDGRPARVLRRNKPLGYGDYPAEVGINVPLTEVKARGIYLVETAATLQPGGSSNLRFCMYQGGD
jgi:hypothetical protein